MAKPVKCILLIDDSEADNFFHQILIEDAGVSEHVEAVQSGEAALEFLASGESPDHPQPELIFLDINMPGMNGWEFLENYEKLPDDQKGDIVVVMLTTSTNPADEALARQHGIIKGFNRKPLTEETLLAAVAELENL